MRAEKVVKSLLAADAGVTAIIGAKLWGGVAAQDEEPPFVVYRKIATTRDEGMDPDEITPGAATCIVRAQIEITCVAAQYEGMKTLGEAVRNALAYQRGTVAGVELLGIFIDSEGADEFNPERDEFFQTWVFRVEHSEP